VKKNTRLALPRKHSMSCAERGAKEEWLSLFADDATLEGPAGRSPLDKEGKRHRGKDAISTFYDRHITSGGSDSKSRILLPAGRKWPTWAISTSSSPTAERACVKGCLYTK
jgi:hypothetical protein